MKSIIQLTTTARDHGQRQGLLQRLESLRLDTWLVAGDVLALGDEAKERFQIRERRIELDEEGAVSALVFLLDYPARQR